MEERMMALALEQARLALAAGEIPVGAVIARGDAVIAAAHNRRELDRDPTAHAEVVAIRQAARALGGRRLTGCTLYVTLEPCPMCAGAIINARIPTLVYGAKDAATGSCGSVIDLFFEAYGHRPAVYSGVLADECAQLLKDFFQEKR